MTKLSINYTKDVSRFKFYSENRDITTKEARTHQRKLRDKILKNGFLVPIMVDDKDYIIDGQNRIEAVKMITNDIKYNQESIDIPYIKYSRNTDTNGFIITLNKDRKDWKHLDYAHYYSTRGNVNYKYFLKINREFKLTPFCIIQHNRLFGGNVILEPITKKDKESKTIKGFKVKAPSGYSEHDFKNGNFRLTRKSYNKFVEYKHMKLSTFFKQYSKYKKIWKDGYTEYEHIRNITSLYNYRAKHRIIKYALGIKNR
jgi:disulfide oxidoreductase YuzD